MILDEKQLTLSPESIASEVGDGLVDGAPLAGLLAWADDGSERELLERATDLLVDLLGERGACIRTDGEPRVALATDDERLRDRPIALERYPEILEAIEERRVVVVEDVLDDPRMKPVLSLLPAAVRSLVVVPLVTGRRRGPGRVLGAILIRSAAAPRRPSARSLATAWVVGQLTAQLIRALAQTPTGRPARTGEPGASLREARERRASMTMRRKTVLVIEDDPSHATMVVAVLERRGYQVTVARSGAEGIERAAAAPPDVILLDVWMPAIDGFSTAEQLKRDPRTRDVPILFLSACDDAIARVRGLELGAVDFLPKPFYAPELLARVERSLRQAESRERLRVQAQIDELTGLGNLRFLREQLALAESRVSRLGTSLAMVMIDVDRLKQINDHHGHPAGSQVLAQIGRVLRASIRETDVAARYGGDEFVVVLPHSSLDEARRFGDRVLARIAGLRWSWGAVTVSVGVAAVHGAATLDGPASELAGELLRRADQAAYQAKQQGGDRVCIFEGHLGGYGLGSLDDGRG